MDSKFVERFQNYENLLFLYRFFKKTSTWLCENFYKEKIELIFCEYSEKIELLSSVKSSIMSFFQKKKNAKNF